MADNRIAVLVVDDELVDIRVIETCLQAAGYSIFTAEGYDEALATFEAPWTKSTCCSRISAFREKPE
jgi:CheY-like chemotaxis protein